MRAKYLLRFDDICPTMNWQIWEQVDAVLKREDIKPILAVVPDNLDPKLQAAPARAEFWQRLRTYQQLGWTIGLHGYQHRYVNKSAGLVGIHAGSEFAGLSRADQQVKLQAALAIFRREGLVAKVWVAPGHSFDWETVAILADLGVTTISDGYFWRALVRGRSTWIPQQLWRLRWMPTGLWTVCYHINAWSNADVAGFSANLRRFRRQVVSLPEVLASEASHETWFDRGFSQLWRAVLLTMRNLRQS